MQFRVIFKSSQKLSFKLVNESFIKNKILNHFYFSNNNITYFHFTPI